MPPDTPLLLLSPPYRTLAPVSPSVARLLELPHPPGSAVIWSMESPPQRRILDLVETRPGGLALIVILPSASEVREDPASIYDLQRCRPHGILPHHKPIDVGDLCQVLRRPPVDLAAEVTDYLKWRGIVVDRETVQVIRRMVELSSELHSVTAIARGMYLSRRALGRRLMSRGLPVPSHWLQIARILRMCSKLQNSTASIFSLACAAGYPDGFSFSNQMHRLLGVRPTDVRQSLGWEWILETWLRREAAEGGLTAVETPDVISSSRMAKSNLGSFGRRRIGGT